ncbi:hypothetical protein BKA70DRAFT_1487367 [Coprinopsis sp. MPI-PUGE-AT-0042]|nr:hypothetical protein BKA70DRAFT_1487367 [Coprinopsis sp. MPI-PUGE-AT-0042]
MSSAIHHSLVVEFFLRRANSSEGEGQEPFHVPADQKPVPLRTRKNLPHIPAKSVPSNFAARFGMVTGRTIYGALDHGDPLSSQAGPSKQPPCPRYAPYPKTYADRVAPLEDGQLAPRTPSPGASDSSLSALSTPGLCYSASSSSSAASSPIISERQLPQFYKRLLERNLLSRSGLSTPATPYSDVEPLLHAADCQCGSAQCFAHQAELAAVADSRMMDELFDSLIDWSQCDEMLQEA